MANLEYEKDKVVEILEEVYQQGYSDGVNESDLGYDKGWEDGEKAGRQNQKEDMELEMQEQVKQQRKQSFADGFVYCLQMCEREVMDEIGFVRKYYHSQLQMWVIGSEKEHMQQPPLPVARKIVV